MQMYTCMTQD